MIDKSSFTPEWITAACERHAVTDPKVLERVIHAFALLEMLADSGLDFVFKGGTCIMLPNGNRLVFFSEWDTPISTRLTATWKTRISYRNS